MWDTSITVLLFLLIIFSISVFQDKPGALDFLLKPENSSIKFDNVHFEYVAGSPILNGLSFEVPSGKKVAIVGGSGSGYVYTNTYIKYTVRFL